jgi:hypothetical protein
VNVAAGAGLEDADAAVAAADGYHVTVERSHDFTTTAAAAGAAAAVSGEAR